MRISFVGLGEAASAVIQGWGPSRAAWIAAYDIKMDDPATAGEICDHAERLGIRCCETLADTIGDAAMIFPTVTADQAVAAAQAAAPSLPHGAFWCDLNSCAPSSKQRAADMIKAAGGRYVDVAVMAPVHLKLNMVPCLLSGAHVEVVAEMLAALPMDVRVVTGGVGRVSSIKMVRSIMVKGLEALTAECVLAAVAAGVEDEVLPSLLTAHPKLGVAERAAYNFERSLRHGVRRAAEMDEVAVMLSDLGLPNGMSASAADWQRLIGTSGIAVPGDDAGYHAIAETLLNKLR